MPPPPVVTNPIDPHSRFSPQSFEALLESHFSAIILYDEHGRTIFASPHSERLTGWTVEERMSRPGWELIHPEDLEDAGRLWLYLLGEDGREVHFEQRILAKDGATIWLEVHMKNMLKDPDLGAIVRELPRHHRAASRLRPGASQRAHPTRARQPRCPHGPAEPPRHAQDARQHRASREGWRRREFLLPLRRPRRVQAGQRPSWAPRRRHLLAALRPALARCDPEWRSIRGSPRGR